MAPSKIWMSLVNDRLNEQYKVGVTEFLDYAFSKTGEEHEIRCPCVKCKNTDKGSRELVEMHLHVYGMMPSYTFWYHHGERRDESQSGDEEVDESEEEIHEILQDFYLDYYNFNESETEIGSSSRAEHKENPNEKADAFYRLLKDVEQPTYPKCKTSKLSTLVNLLHIKSVGRWSNESFDMLLKLLKEILPTGSTLPATYYDSKKIIKDLGLSSNISQCVNIKEHRISGLKSHDCHILLEYLLPIGIRGLLPKSVCEPLIELSMFFTSLCANTVSVDELKQIESQISITLCKLEQVFLPLFFDVMVHLPVHLACEAIIGGPVQYRWMYPIERMLYELKKFIRNMARPEGSIAEGYIVKECMTLCSRYFRDIKTKFNKLDRNYDGYSHKNEAEVSVFPQFGRALGAGISRDLTDEERLQAHIYVLKNCDEVQPFLEEYLGDLKANGKVKVSATVAGRIEEEIMVYLFITISKSFDAKKDLEAIGQYHINQEFHLPQKAAGHFLVVKYSHMNEDGSCDEPVFVVSAKTVESLSPQKEKKVRGGNKNKKVASLRSGEKLDVTFFNNRPVDRNHEAWSRHLGKIVRDSNICPVRVQSWKDIGNAEKQHMWEAVKECFTNPNIELYREHTLEHMGVLWGAWRSRLYVDYVKPYKNKVHALKKVPRGMNNKDWEWLVTNKFLTKEFQDISDKNSKNRSKSSMPHLTGSRPHREIIYEKGGKDSKIPDLGVIFFETRSKNGTFKGTKEKNKYDEIVKTIQSNPSHSNLELADMCFGPQRHGIVYGYGGGVKRKTFHDSRSSYTKELEEKLNEKEEENRLLRKRMDGLEERLNRIENELIESPSEEDTTVAD